MASVEELGAGLGLKVPLAPLGKPVTASVTEAEKPPLGVMVTVKLVDPPGETAWLGGAMLRLKSGATGPPVVSGNFCVVHCGKPKRLGRPVNMLLPHTTPALTGSGVAPE